MKSLLETYAKRIQVAESVYNKEHAGKLDKNQKVTLAQVLKNTSSWLNEAYASSTGTQRSDMGMFKRFTLDVTTLALPNTIANELVVVRPMTSMTGYITFVQTVAGSNKGGVAQGDVFNDPFALGNMNESRINYTGSAVVEDVTIAGDGSANLAWFPLFTGFTPVVVGGESGTVVEIIDASTGAIKVTGATGTVKIKYMYDNVYIPQNDLPILNAKVRGIQLTAHARRIAIYYSQIAAFQAKTEMGMDLADMLSTQACAELTYEIDTEVIKLLENNAPVVPALAFNRTERNGVSLAQHYEGFAVKIAKASQYIYDKTQKYSANFMIVSSSIIPMLSVMSGFKPVTTSKMSGPYFAGTFNNLKVFVSPAVAVDKYIVGYNGDDFASSPAIYAPYMAIVPTQSLGFADGSMSQGFSTLYDLKMLNDNLLVAGEVYDAPQVVDTRVVNG